MKTRTDDKVIDGTRTATVVGFLAGSVVVKYDDDNCALVADSEIEFVSTDNDAVFTWQIVTAKSNSGALAL